MRQEFLKQYGKYLVTIGILILLFMVLTQLLASELNPNLLQQFDFAIITWVQSWITPLLTDSFNAITYLGSVQALIILVIITSLMLFIFKKTWEGILYIFTVAAGGGLNWLLKWIIHRERPDINPLVVESGYSFPSGHSMMAIIAYGMLAYYFVLFLQSKATKSITVIAFTILIFLIGLSRIYLGVHYPSDVIAGYAVGGAWLGASIIALEVLLRRRESSRHSTEKSVIPPG
ncbi:phosphatase PAP2 family protein [Bacillus sp. FJAT-44742]|uniref:phosphatase PAP2 family protein n=1 Tax=Bacillus sp. FJAT-44742 TaxID=2014005 RepID=UPI000C23CC2B|nr:phosphatase PAP2 family protein [Bacillus sp. FJAT-44742]